MPLKPDWEFTPTTIYDKIFTALLWLLFTLGIIFGMYLAINNSPENPEPIIPETAFIYEQGGGSEEVVEKDSTEPTVHKEDIEWTIRRLAEPFGVDAEDALRIARCESTLNPSARNPESSALGLYQFTDSTWAFIGSPGDREDYWDSTVAFLRWYPSHPEWWACR